MTINAHTPQACLFANFTARERIVIVITVFKSHHHQPHQLISVFVFSALLFEEGVGRNTILFFFHRRGMQSLVAVTLQSIRVCVCVSVCLILF